MVGLEMMRSVNEENACLLYTSRNKHHMEYWIDYGVPDEGGDKGLCGMKMPLRYVVEMYIDRVAASKNYQKERYTDRSALEYYLHGKDFHVMHKDTRALLELLLYRLAVRGEQEVNTFIREELLDVYKRQVLCRVCRLQAYPGG